MAAADPKRFADVLGIAHPWQVTDVQVTEPTRTVIVRVEHLPERGSGLFGRRAPAPLQRQCRWDHLPIAGQRCQLVLGLREREQAPVASWTGDRQAGFTRGLQRLIMDLMLAGATLEQLCVLLRLPVGELWRHKYHLDKGAAGQAPAGATAAGIRTAEEQRPPPAAGAKGADAAAEPTGRPGPEDGLPPAGAAVWTELLLGRAPLRISALSLRLLLSKLQRDARMHTDEDLHAQAAGDLHRYFVKNRATLLQEVAQLNLLHSPARLADQREPASGQQHDERLASPAGQAQAELRFKLPDASDPLWLELLQGQLPLEVRTLGLKLLLAKLRQQIKVIRDEEVRMVKLVELHRYFIRHQSSLDHEIHQLRRLRAD